MPSIEIKSASIEEALPVLQAIPEFSVPVTKDALTSRLTNKKVLLLVAYIDGSAAGVKLGYAQDDQQFYSWLGGVLPTARGFGIAQTLLDYQELWAQQQGYHRLQVKTRNQFPKMIHMLVKNRYMIVNTESHPDPLENRIYFEKNFEGNKRLR